MFPLIDDALEAILLAYVDDRDKERCSARLEALGLDETGAWLVSSDYAEDAGIQLVRASPR